MNTIHSTFNRVNSSYTVIGGDKQGSATESKDKISVVLLSRHGRPFRSELLKELITLGFGEILSVQIVKESHIESDSGDNNDNIRCVLIKNKVTAGEMVNIGISECLGDYVFVLWDDMNITSKNISSRVFEKIKESNKICTCPILTTSEGSIIPSLMTPLFNNDMLKIVQVEDSPSLKTIYPFQYVGIYNKELFVRSGGYDIDILNSYWQKLDFGLRANMWGETIVAHKAFQMILNLDKGEVEDITPDESYRLYSLKNLSVIIKKDIGYLPIKRFFSFLDKSGSSMVDAYKIFSMVRSWVKTNRYRFKYSAIELTKNWDKE